MTQTPPSPKDIYEFIENDSGEIMLLLYAGESAPAKAFYRINEAKKCLELYRNAKDAVIIEGLELESINKLKKIETLYICEMKYNENPDNDNEIIYAYETHPQPVAPKTPKKSAPKKVSSASVAEKAQKAREKILKKEG